jgi:hypothetical protein
MMNSIPLFAPLREYCCGGLGDWHAVARIISQDTTENARALTWGKHEHSYRRQQIAAFAMDKK